MSRHLRVPLLAFALLLVLAACGSAEEATSTDRPAGLPPARCDWEMNTVSFWEQDPPTAAAGEHEHMGNSHGAQTWTPLVDSGKCTALQAQMDRMDAVAERYPTAQDALDAGCYRATIFVPGIAAHYVCTQNYSQEAKLDTPLMLLYAGSDPTAPMVGLSYMVYSDGPPNEVQGAPLWVRYMPWHFHSGLCVNAEGLVIGGDNSDPTTCEARGGKVQGKTGWMGHYWLDSCPSPDGVFSADNPRLDWEVGRFNDAPDNAADTVGIVAEPCQGSKMAIDAEGGDRFGKPTGMNDWHLVGVTTTEPGGTDGGGASDGHTHDHTSD